MRAAKPGAVRPRGTSSRPPKASVSPSSTRIVRCSVGVPLPLVEPHSSEGGLRERVACPFIVGEERVEVAAEYVGVERAAGPRRHPVAHALEVKRRDPFDVHRTDFDFGPLVDVQRCRPRIDAGGVYSGEVISLALQSVQHVRRRGGEAVRRQRAVERPCNVTPVDDEVPARARRVGRLRGDGPGETQAEDEPEETDRDHGCSQLRRPSRVLPHGSSGPSGIGIGSSLQPYIRPSILPPVPVRFLVPVFAFALLLGAASVPPPQPSNALAAVDTLRLSVRSGEPLVAALPGESAWTFRSLRAPALSWLVGRSFYWKTLPGERGREYVLIERRYQSVPQDTLVVVIDVGTP